VSLKHNWYDKFFFDSDPDGSRYKFWVKDNKIIAVKVLGLRRITVQQDDIYEANFL